MEIGSIRREVRKMIADRIANGEQVRINWMTHEVIQRHCGIEGDDKPFYLVCAYAYVHEIVRTSVAKYKPKPISDAQLVMDGFTHLQVAYTVERHGETILVPVDQITDAELLARATEYDTMAKGCRDHAVEIRKYVKSRSVGEIAA